MNRWGILAVVALLRGAHLSAAGCCAQVEVAGEFLYARPQICDLDYAIEDPRSFVGISDTTVGPLGSFLPFGKDLFVSPDHEPAFEVGIAYLTARRCVGIGGCYSRIFTADARQVIAPGEGGLWITHAHPRFNSLRLNNRLITNGFSNLNALEPIPEAFAVVRLRLTANVVDGVGLVQSVPASGLWIRAQMGVRWVLLEAKEDLSYQGITAQQTVVGGGPDPATLLQNAELEVLSHNRTWGVGPRAAISVRHAVACGFGIRGRLGASVLAGTSSHHLRQHVVLEGLITGENESVNVNEELDIHRSGGCHLFPEWDARLGLNYRICCGDWFAVEGEVGWEFVSYVSAIGRVRFNDVGGTSRRVCESFNIDGLYISLRITL